MQTPVFKDIDELSQKATIAGTEKLPVSDTEYITPDQIADLAPSQKQSDWNESDQDDPAYIKNKPTIPDVSGKADKVSSPTSGHFAGLDGNGNLTDSGSKAADFATAAQGGKADSAYQKPGTGIPKSDLASGVQTSLGKADSAYQKPGTGIPAADIAAGVIPDTSNFVQKSNTAGLLKNDGTVDTTSYGTYSKPSGGIPSSDLASAVQTSLGKADTAYQKPSGGVPASDIASGVIPTVPTISTDIATDKASTTKTASPSAVYSEVHPAVGSSQPAGGMLPNVFYDLGTLSGNTTFAFATASDNTIENEWMFEFTTPSTAPTITWPNAITGWAGGTAPTINASKTYQVSVLNGLGVIVEF